MKTKCILWTLTLSVLLLQSCFVTTSHSFNNGKVLHPGNARGTLGFGRLVTKAYRTIEIYGDEIDTTYAFVIPQKDSGRYEKVDVLLHSFSFDFQLGIAKTFPFGKGTNIGFHRELPGYRASKFIGFIPTSELIVKCGLSDIPLGKFIYNHNVLFGWQRGLFIDNGFFVEYAGGFELPNRKIPYFNVRLGMTPTDPTDSDEDLFDAIDDAIYDSDSSSSYFTYNDKRFFGRVCLGNTFQFKRKRPIIPEIFTEATFNIIHRRRIYPTFQLGLSWKSFFNAK